MIRFIIFCTTVLLNLCSSTAFAQTEKTEEVQFKELALLSSLKVLSCDARTRIALERIAAALPVNPVEQLTCIEEAKTAVEPEFKALRNRLDNKQELQKGLKDWYVIWLAAIDGTMPLVSDRTRIGYQRRAEMHSAKLQDATRRLQLDF